MGFTLLEVLVGLAVFAIAAVALSAAYLNVLGNYHRVADGQKDEGEIQLVRAVIQSRRDRAEVAGGGRLALTNDRYFLWTARIAPAALADLYEVHVRVEGSEAPRPIWEIRLMLFRPEWSDPADRDRLRDESRRRLERPH
ncbi:MAG: prepilin-type N-terminal cleavage/methylation domain-containing protein [Opitutae bacterium]|nr:prepilin-type N-terminal cleavage/methylation domain-containing protein [Opitutae bacterium]